MTTVLVDNSTGSVHLPPYLEQAGVTAELAVLEYGDLAWEGNGPDGTVLVGVEWKRLADLVASIRSGRLNDQAKGMAATYDRRVLVVEGLWSASASGELVEWGGSGFRRLPGVKGLQYAYVDRYLWDLEEILGFRVRRVGSLVEGCVVVADMVAQWSKPWEQHHALMAPHMVAAGTGASKVNLRGGAEDLTYRVARQLPGIRYSHDKAEKVVARFGTVEGMVAAAESEWRMPGIGKKGAGTIWGALRGRL